MKRGWICALLCLLATCGAPTALAAPQLEITQAQQQGDRVALYALLTDSATGAVLDGIDSEHLSVSADGDSVVPVTIDTLKQSGEAIAYAVVIDQNTYAMESNDPVALRAQLLEVLYSLREGDRMLLLTTGQTSARLLTNGFEQDRLKIYHTIETFEPTDQGVRTRLTTGIAQALDAFAASSSTLPVRRALLVLSFGTSNTQTTEDAVCHAAENAGVPIYAITLAGSRQGLPQSAPFTLLEKVTQASGGRLLDGRTDLSAAIAAFISYTSGTVRIIIAPPQKAWDALHTQWSLSVQWQNARLADTVQQTFVYTLQPTASPSPLAQGGGALSALPWLLLGLAGAAILVIAGLWIGYRRQSAPIDTTPTQPINASFAAVLPSAQRLPESMHSLNNDGEETMDSFGIHRQPALGRPPLDITVSIQSGDISRTEQRVLAYGDALIIGRQAGCAICLEDPRISRRHCELSYGPDGLMLRDLKSRNGTRINGAPVMQPTPLQSGDELSIDDIRMMLTINA